MLTSLALIVLIAVVVSYRNALRSLHQRMDLTETALANLEAGCSRSPRVRAHPRMSSPRKRPRHNRTHATAQIPACRTATERSATD